jgi:hypothetical protein
MAHEFRPSGREEPSRPVERIDSAAFEDPVEASCPICGSDIHLSDTLIRTDGAVAHAACALTPLESGRPDD